MFDDVYQRLELHFYNTLFIIMRKTGKDLPNGNKCTTNKLVVTILYHFL